MSVDKTAVLLLAVAGYAGLIAVFGLQAFRREPFDFTSGTMRRPGFSRPSWSPASRQRPPERRAASAEASAATSSRAFRGHPLPPAVCPRWAVSAASDRSLLKAAVGLPVVVGGLISFATIVSLILPPKLAFERAAWFDAPPEQVWAS